MKYSLLFFSVFSVLGFYSRASDSASVETIVSYLKEQKTSQSRAWQKLLHYDHTYFRFMEFQVDSPEFYLAVDSTKSDAENFESELEATVRSFYSTLNAKEEASTICRFPARYAFVKALIEENGMSLPSKDCPRFQSFFNAIVGDSVSIIFSSYYLNNPSSAYGHTFLRFNKPRNSRLGQSELLDYGLNFAANPTTNNALVYSLMGLAGGFKGTFTTQPYYFKVREYNNSESRDLWEYRLSLKPSEVDFLVRHLWELGPAWIDYFYLSENCSYHVLSLIEVARPSLSLMKHLKPNVIPTDTIQILYAQEGLVTDIQYRPSIRRQFYSRVEALSIDQKLEILRLFKEKSVEVDPKYDEPKLKVLILDALMDYVDYQNYYEVQVADSPTSRYKNQVLMARSRVPIVSEELKIQAPLREAPHLSHKTSRLTLGYRKESDSKDFYEFQYRFALHDQVDPVVGYPDYAVIDFFNFKFGLDQKNGTILIEELTMLGLNSSSPLDIFSRTPSWRLQIGMLRMASENCWRCQAWGLNGGIGGTFELGAEKNASINVGVRAAAYALTESTETLNSPYILGMGPAIRFRYRIADDFITLAEHWTRWDATGQYRRHDETSVEVQKSFHNSWGIRAKYSDYQFHQSAGIGWVWYH